MEGNSIPSWQKENTGVLAKKLDFAASIICKRCYKYLSNGIYHFQSQNISDLAKKIDFDGGSICQICYNVFFQVITYICHSVFNISRALTMVTWPVAKKIYFDAGIICQICYNVFFQVVTYICQSVFNISRALTMVTWPRSLTLLLAVFILSLGLAFVTLAVWIMLRYSCL